MNGGASNTSQLKNIKKRSKEGKKESFLAE
jgi:hypothetical protein